MCVQIETFFRDILGATDDELVRALSQGATIRSVSKGDRLIEAGEVPTRVYFLVSGVVRCFSTDAEGHENTECIISEPGGVLMPTADLSVPSPNVVEVLTAGEVISVELSLIATLLETSLPANHLYIKLLTRAWHDHWEGRRVVSQLRAKDRYLWFLKTHPGLIDKAPNKYIASLLGMTPVTLSRLRAELREEASATQRATDAE